MCYKAGEIGAKVKQLTIWQRWKKMVILGRTYTAMLLFVAPTAIFFLWVTALLSVCKLEAHCVARGQGSPSALRWGFCFRLLGCLGEADLSAVTYLRSSLPDGHRHIIGKDLGCTLPTVFHILCFVPSLIGFHSGAEQRISELPPLSLLLRFSLFFSASHNVGKDKYRFQNTRKPNPSNSWLSKIRIGITILWWYHCSRHTFIPLHSLTLYVSNFKVSLLSF